MSDLSTQFNQSTVDIGMVQAKGKQGPDAANQTDKKITPGRIRKLWNDGSKVVRPEQRQYWLNKAAVRGEQWTYWDRQRDKLTQMPETDRVRVTVNKMGPASRSIASKATKRELVFEVVPKASDDKSVLAARIAEAVLEDIHREHRWERLRETEFWARWEGGTAVIALDWDPKAGVTVGHDEESDEDFGTGEIKESVLSIAECCTEPGERDIETARWWIKVTTMPPAKAKDVYSLPELPAADATMALSPFQTQVMSTDNRQVQVPMTLVLTYYERPSNSNPDGQVGVVVGDNLVQWSKWPFPFKERLNLVCFRETKVGDRWNGDTILSSAQPVQTGLNASWSSILEHLKKAANARLAVPETSMDSIDELTDDTAELFFYNSVGPAPSWMAPPSMPAWWVQMPELLDTALQDILSWHQDNNGGTPANLESGLGLSILSEGDDSPMEAMVKETSEGWQRYAVMVLKMYAEKVKESRTARIEGPGQAPQTVKWQGAAIKDCFDVRVPVDAIMPVSQAAAHARAQALWDRQIIRDPKVYAKIAQLPFTKDLVAALDPDMAKAQRENLDLSSWTPDSGEPPVPATFDNHATHIAVHNDYRKSEAYEHLPTTPVTKATDPATGEVFPVSVKDLVDLHVQAHETLAAEATGTQLAQQMVHPALGASPNANGQQPVPDEGPPLPAAPITAVAPPPEAPEPGQGGIGPGVPAPPGGAPQ